MIAQKTSEWLFGDMKLRLGSGGKIWDVLGKKKEISVSTKNPTVEQCEHAVILFCLCILIGSQTIMR